MTRPDFITGLLDQRYAACLHSSRRRRTARHWRAYPAVAFHTVETAAAVAADAYHPDHNRVAAALLAAHRARPGTPADTEMILLLVAARPLVLVLDPRDRHRDSRASLWACVASQLATLDPTTLAASPVPWLVALLGRIRPDAARYPSEPAPTPTVGAPFRLAALEQHAAPRSDVADAAIARCYLSALRSDRVWPRLARYTVHGRTSGIPKSSMSRHRRRLADELGYVA